MHLNRENTMVQTKSLPFTQTVMFDTPIGITSIWST